MTLSREAMLELMALADGELEGEERVRVEKLAAEDEDARRVLESMRSPALGSFVGHAFAQRAAAADGIADAVMAKLSAGGGAGAETDGVVRLADARARRGPRVQVAVASGFAALAIAAAIALWVQSRDQIMELGSPVASVGVPVPSLGVEPSSPRPTAQSATPLAQEGTRVPGVEVDEIDSPQHDVHVFEIPVGTAPSAAAAAAHVTAPSSVVIMIEDQPGGGQ